MIGLVAGVVQETGRSIQDAIDTAGYACTLFLRSVAWFRSAIFKRREILDQMYICGIESVPVTLVVGLFTGMILAYQTGIELSKYSQQSVVGALVSITLCREMGPFMTGLILAANVGSSMAAELGTMKVSEEIDALDVMTIDESRFLVMPRLFAMILVTPMLTVMTNVVGIIGGGIISVQRLDVKWTLYSQYAVDILKLKDVYSGLFKAMVFGMIIAIVGCSLGLRASGGALGVGQATRRSVITCYLLILVSGFFMTAMFYGL